MILDTLKIKNFRGYQTETIIPISNLTAFIGRNDAGKSTILEALEKILIIHGNFHSFNKSNLLKLFLRWSLLIKHRLQ